MDRCEMMGPGPRDPSDRRALAPTLVRCGQPATHEAKHRVYGVVWALCCAQCALDLATRENYLLRPLPGRGK